MQRVCVTRMPLPQVWLELLPCHFTLSDSVQSPSPFARHALSCDSTVSDLVLADLFAFTVSIPGQQQLVLCSSNEKERLQWRLAFTCGAPPIIFPRIVFELCLS